MRGVGVTLLENYNGMDAIGAMVRAASLDQLPLKPGSETPILAEEGQLRGPVYGTWMALILIGSHQVRVTLKCFYTATLPQRLIAQNRGNDIASVNDTLVHDFMREYMNLVAGAVKRSLHHSQVDVGVSLPLVTRGFDEIFRRPHDATATTDLWSLRFGIRRLIWSSLGEPIDHAAVAGIHWQAGNPATPPESVDMEFL